TRRVALTPAGRTLLDEARVALAVMRAVTRRTRRAARSTPTMIVTAKPGATMSLLRRIVDSYRTLEDAQPVDIVVSGYGEQTDMVRDGRADVALVGMPFDEQGLDVEPLTTEPRVAALPAGHELAKDSEVCLRAFEGRPVPQWPEQSAFESDYWTGQDRRPAGGEPALPGPVVNDVGQLLEVVALGQAIALIPQSLADGHPRRDVAYRPVAGASPYTTAAVWSEGSRSSHIARFVKVAAEIAAQD
ncbi:MAG: LysR family substrate-binding domain-containing protein, partial [Stackebrandtia sp.]